MITAQILYLKIRESEELLLQNFTKIFENGTIYSILGKNGCGKTTLLNLLVGSLPNNIFSYKNNIIYDEKNLDLLDKKNEIKFRKNNIRYIFQDSINSFNPLKRIKYFFKNFQSEKKIIEELFKYFELPLFDEICNLHIYEMSGGMAQRIQIILALLAKPKYLFLDEPTSALDYPVANLFSKKLKEFTTENKTVTIIVTQDARFAIDCSNEIAVLQNSSLLFTKNNKDYSSLVNKLSQNI